MCPPVIVILPQLKADWITILPFVDTLQIKMFTFSNTGLLILLILGFLGLKRT